MDCILSMEPSEGRQSLTTQASALTGWCSYSPRFLSVLCLHRLRLYSDPEQLKAAFYEFKVVADQKKVVTDADLEALMDFSSQQSEESWVLSSVYVTSGAYAPPDWCLRV